MTTTFQLSGMRSTTPPIITKSSIETLSPAIAASRRSMSKPPAITVIDPPRKSADWTTRWPPPQRANSFSCETDLGAENPAGAASPARAPSKARPPGSGLDGAARPARRVIVCRMR